MEKIGENLNNENSLMGWIELSMILYMTFTHIRRIDLEDKAKVVAFAWGAESLPR